MYPQLPFNTMLLTTGYKQNTTVKGDFFTHKINKL